MLGGVGSEMPKGELVVCGNFEWWSEKNDLNKINHKDKNNKGIGFEDILDVSVCDKLNEKDDKLSQNENIEQSNQNEVENDNSSNDES